MNRMNRHLGQTGQTLQRKPVHILAEFVDQPESVHPSELIMPRFWVLCALALFSTATAGNGNLNNEVRLLPPRPPHFSARY